MTLWQCLTDAVQIRPDYRSDLSAMETTRVADGQRTRTESNALSTRKSLCWMCWTLPVKKSTAR